jgi:hypothetical protein
MLSSLYHEARNILTQIIVKETIAEIRQYVFLAQDNSFASIKVG